MSVFTFKEFKKLSKRGNLVALRLEIPSDLETPVSAFLKLQGGESCAFLLESAEQEERLGRYSFLGFDPEKVVIARGGEVLLKEKNRATSFSHGNKQDVLQAVRKIISHYRLANPEGLPSFAGGFVGFLGYENVQLFERVKLKKKNGLHLDDSVFFLIKDFLIFDHFRKKLTLISLAETDERPLKKSYEASIRRLKNMETKLQKSLKGAHQIERHIKNSKPFNSNITRPEFKKRLERIKKYITAGDCIQVVFSQRFHLGHIENDFEIYRHLRSINPSPYMFYFRHGSLRLIGSSPELLVKKSGRIVDVRPIAGTRIRGKTPGEDAKLEANLTRSVKEMAEHLMLVDLGRNDLGRVCKFNSIRVKDFARVERYSHVMHLVSSVTGHLKEGKDAFDLLRATFPAGTVTGAPKIRAMEIIDELEPETRGPYAGSLGYFSFTQDMDMCLMIRTLMVVNGEAYVQAGAGVVYDSHPDREYEETLSKAKALMQAVRGRDEGGD